MATYGGSAPAVVPPSQHSSSSSGRDTPGTTSSDKAAAAAVPQENQNADMTALKLRRSWRPVVSSAIVAFRTADKFRTKLAELKQQNPSLDTSLTYSNEVDEAVVTSLRARADLRKNITVLEGKLSGQAQEAEALESCMRTQSRLGRKRRKRNPITTNDGNNGGATTTATTETYASAPSSTTAPPAPLTVTNTNDLNTFPQASSTMTPAIRSGSTNTGFVQQHSPAPSSTTPQGPPLMYQQPPPPF